MPKARILYIVTLVLLLTSCSRTTLNLKKNTWRTRAYHNTTSKYNIYFNGNESYKEGVRKIREKNINDYTRVLPVFEDGIHENFSTSTTNMEYAVTKANKIIQLHSIKKKPPYNPKKIKDPKYREWRNQEEFNIMVDDAYMMLGKSSFYQEKFLESIGIFNYVTLKYPGEDICYLANLWIARAYLEMGWLYEAENMLNLVNDDNLPYQHKQFYNIVSADFYIKMGEYPEAVPFLKGALEERLKSHDKQRLKFILAQIYQGMGDNELAYNNYKSVVRSFPEYEMELYARIRMTEVMSDNDVYSAIRKLKKMLNSPNNLDYQGQIYYALGNIYTNIEERYAAIENYRLSLAFSEDFQKGVTSKTIADLYWAERDYRGAQPYYGTAKENLSEADPDIQQVDYRADVLEELASYYDVMGDVDREFKLSQMTEQEQKEFLKEEKELAKREEEIQELIAEASGKNEEEEALKEDSKESKGSWYFYNSKLVETGREQFKEQWGNRELKDNWRRTMAGEIVDTEDEDTEMAVEENETIDTVSQELAQDTVLSEEQKEKEAAKALEEEQKQKVASNKAIVDAYFNLAALYQYDIEDYEIALETYETLEALYPRNAHSPDSYFAIYNLSNAFGDVQRAEEAKQIILKDYPESNYALILTDPNAQEILATDRTKYNMLYEETFDLFVKGENYKVLSNIRQLKTEYRDSSLQAKVLLMEALATAKTDRYADIRPQLQNISSNYANDTVVKEQADIILAKLKAGEEIVAGGSAANTLAERRNKTAEIEHQKLREKLQYKYEPEARHYMVFVMVDSLNVNRNQLQFDVAKFNFNKFMTMDFDLAFMQLNLETSMFIINGFANEEEGKWYKKEFLATSILDKHQGVKKMYIISEENFRLMIQLGTLKEYDAFDNKH